MRNLNKVFADEDDPNISSRHSLVGIFAMPTLAELGLSVDYFWGDDEKGDGWKDDFELLELKAGYALIESAKGRLEPYCSYLNLEAGGDRRCYLRALFVEDRPAYKIVA